MIVVFDTNVWISDLALKSSVGSAVRFYLRENKARIGLPEVVKLETEFHLRTMLEEHIETIRSLHRQVLALFGQLKEVVLPTPQDVEELISQVFTNLGVQIETIPFTLESAKASLIRVVRKIPPSRDKDQQFKDGVLWEDCLGMLKKEPVLLVTEDRAFFKSRNPELGLADELKKDLKGLPNQLKVFSSLQGLLSQITTRVPIEPAALISAYLDANGDRLKSMAADHSFTLSRNPTVDLEVFCTEKPALLYFAFTIEMPCTDATDENRTGAKILVRGEGTYDAEGTTFVELSNRGERLSYQLQDGTEMKVENTVFVVGGLTIGHRTVDHSVRYKLG